jgi:hypothetical protein
MIRKLCLGLLLLASATAAHAQINLSASAGNARVSLSWSYSGVTAATQEVYRDTDSNPSGRVRIASVSAGTRSHTDTSAANGTTYWYWIKNTNSGTVTNSNAASATPTGSGSGSSSSGGGYTAVTSQYTYRNITTGNALYRDSAHFRVYYGTNGRNAGGILGHNSEAQVIQALDYLEAAYDYWIVQRGFRSPGRPVNGRPGGPFKMNVYATNDLNAGGAMGYDYNAGLPYLVVHTNQMSAANVYVHEFGHCITLSEYYWVDKGNTGAWWETIAQWHTDDFLAFASQHATVAARYGRPTSGTIIELNSTISQSHLTLVHANNRYQAWPFFSYLNANPDGYSGLGGTAVRNMYRAHQGNETPLQTVARMTSTPWQRVVGQYWARMAYLDINHPLARQRLFSTINNSSFRAASYRNLSSVGNYRYRVIPARQPMYGGANINPLTLTGDGNISVDVYNLGNGSSDSNFTATLAIRNTSSGAVRYVAFSNAGTVSAYIGGGEEATLVVANTPNNLITYNAFESTGSAPELRGLNYEVMIVGARPRDL